MNKIKLTFQLRLLFLLVLIIGISLATLAYINFNKAKIQVLQNEIETLQIINALKSQQIYKFFEDLEDKFYVIQDYFNIKRNLPIVSQFYQNVTSEEYLASKKMLDDQLQALVDKGGFYDLTLLNNEGKVVYNISKDRFEKETGKNLLDSTNKVFQEGKIDLYFSNIFYNSHSSLSLSMLLSGPIYGFNGEFQGVVVLEIDMTPIYDGISDSRFLGKTGETLLGRNEGEYALFLHDLKYNADAAFKKKNILYR